MKPTLKPILFKDSMVRAILQGEKTQTRRTVKLPGEHKDFTFKGMKTDPQAVNIQKPGKVIQLNGLYGLFEDNSGSGRTGYYKHRIGIAPGDVLYVREVWQHAPASEDSEESGAYDYLYKADQDDPNAKTAGKWKSSMHMPRDAARLFLTVTDVSVEHVQDITAKAARNEGCRGTNDPRSEFMNLWDSINLKLGLGWDENPFVWVYTFKRMPGNATIKDFEEDIN